MLERMTKALETRGRDGDEAATKDLEKLLHKGSLVRAVGFLARSLGEETCDRIVQEMWAAPADVPALPAALAKLPFRHVWTTFPGDILEHAFETTSPEGWPPARVVTYQELGELSPRRRTIVKMLGSFDTYVVTPGSVRRALSRAVDLREYARKLYVEGSLVFVGFRYGDPDLSALLDCVFGMFEPPRGTHYFLGAGVGPVTIDELMADHRIEVVNLPGRGGDEVAQSSVLESVRRAWRGVREGELSLTPVAARRRRRRGLDCVARRGRRRGRRGERRARADRAQGARGQQWDTVVGVLLGRDRERGRAGDARGVLAPAGRGLRDRGRRFEGRVRGDHDRAAGRAGR